MSTDPMMQGAGNLSINRFTGDGSKTNWDINFAGGYMQQADVKAFTTFNGVNTIVSLTFAGPNTVTVAPAVAAGTTLTIYRDTPKSGPVVDFTNGSIVNEANLDKLAAQSVLAAAEMVDRFSVVADNATLALTNSQLAINLAASLTGADVTKFERTDVAITVSANRTYTGVITVPTQSPGDNTQKAASTAFVIAQIAAGGFATSSQLSTAASGAQSAAISAAATDATNKDNVVKAAIQKQLDWLYLLSTR